MSPRALTTQIGRADRVSPRRRVEDVLDHETGPSAVEIEIMSIRKKRRELRPRRSSTHFRDRNASIRASKPLHVAQAILETEYG